MEDVRTPNSFCMVILWVSEGKEMLQDVEEDLRRMQTGEWRMLTQQGEDWKKAVKEAKPI